MKAGSALRWWFTAVHVIGREDPVRVLARVAQVVYLLHDQLRILREETGSAQLIGRRRLTISGNRTQVLCDSDAAIDEAQTEVLQVVHIRPHEHRPVALLRSLRVPRLPESVGIEVGWERRDRRLQLLHRARELLQSLLKSPATSLIRDRRASGFTHGAAADGGARSAAKRWK
jgi:hypothetical protein